MKFQGIELRDYTEIEILKECDELEDGVYEDIREEVEKKLNTVNELPFESVNVQGLENADYDVAGYEKCYGFSYYLNFHELFKAEAFPPPVIIQKDAKFILLGGNRRMTVLYLLSPNKEIPCKIIKVNE